MERGSAVGLGGGRRCVQDSNAAVLPNCHGYCARSVVMMQVAYNLVHISRSRLEDRMPITSRHVDLHGRISPGGLQTASHTPSLVPSQATPLHGIGQASLTSPMTMCHVIKTRLPFPSFGISVCPFFLHSLHIIFLNYRYSPNSWTSTTW
ncbi:hypothetical protein B0T19DRAFT_297764 [Cercophora scortea]|uniref:Uncharacterized protein n=1 Tax=Cercophora scortea TaxID=314031 RepID=A0AAE0I587_9PEZI|nr:hypothetical protein B0T19DRAFT_297764 [Cercophora scortea]